MTDDAQQHHHDRAEDDTSTVTGPQTGPVGTPRGRRSRPVAVGLVLVAAVALALAGLVTLTSRPAVSAGPVHLAPGEHGLADPARDAEPAVEPRPVSDTELANLPQATTFGTVGDAPPDQGTAAPSGRVLHPTHTVPVYLAPGDRAIAALPPLQLANDTWLPIIDQQPGWARVLLPVRPGRSTGWVFTNDPRVTTAHTSHRIVVDRGTFTMTLLHEDREVGRWSVGIGKAESPTPPGRTFLLASIRDTKPTFSPIVLPLGTHSDTHTSYAGGPGTVGIHTWPTGDVYGTASSDGCIRVPPDALEVLSTQVPLGTPVLIG